MPFNAACRAMSRWATWTRCNAGSFGNSVATAFVISRSSFGEGLFKIPPTVVRRASRFPATRDRSACSPFSRCPSFSF